MGGVKDNRKFIEALEKSGDLVRIKRETDWDLEVGAITRRVCEKGAPAPLFENIKGYPNHRILGTPLATQRRLAVALGLDAGASFKEILATFGERKEKPIKPVIVKNAPCKENIIAEKDINLNDFPVPMIHDGDGGRYFSWQVLATKDPDSDWINFGMYRFMILNRNHLAGLIGNYTHAGMILYPKYFAKKKSMPFALVSTPEPLTALVAMLRFGPYENEVDFAGGLLQEPVEVTRCETSDILVPANAEMVIEGEILYNETAPEGPFGEFTGYRSTPRENRSVLKVTRITHRNAPILGVSNMGIPVDDSHIGTSIGVSWGMTKILRENGIPITGAYAPPQGLGNEIAIIGVKKKQAWSSNIACHIGNLVSTQAWQPGMLTKVFVVDEDVDVYNLDEVWHSIASKLHPARSIKIREDEIGVKIAPYLSYEERLRSKGARVIFDCTWPSEWSDDVEIPAKVSFEKMYPEEVKNRVLDNWKKDFGGK